MIFFVSVLFSVASARDFKIGVVLGPKQNLQLVSDELWNPLQPQLQNVESWSTRHIGFALCESGREGARALAVLGLPPRLAPLIASYSDHLQLPLVTDVSRSAGHLHFSLRPDAIRAVADYIRLLNWQDCAFIYDTDHSSVQLSSIFSEDGLLVGPFYRVHSAMDALALLPRTTTRALFATSEEVADDILARMPPSRQFHAILLTSVGVARRPSWTRGGSFLRLTKFSYVQNIALKQEVEHRWQTIDRRTTDQYHIPDSAWLSYDASRVIQNILTSKLPTPYPPLRCFNATKSERIYFNRTTIQATGVSGHINFDEDGRRTSYSLSIIEVTYSGLRQVGIWSSDHGLNTPQVAFRKSEPPIRVTSTVMRPFLMQDTNGKLEGFGMDFLHELELESGRSFELQLVKDNRYGMLMPNGQWNGMVGEVVRGEADFILAPLTKTLHRGQVLAFTKSFLHFGLKILIKRPSHSHEQAYFSPFAFLSLVWPAELYVIFILSVVVAGAVCYSLSRFLGAPDRVRALESKGTDNLSPCGSLWFTVASLLQRDAGIYPRSLTHRLWALFWRFFCLIFILSYISSLTSSLIRARNSIPDSITTSHTTSHQLLQDFLQNGYPVIGLMKYGSTAQFFKNSSIGAFQQLGTYSLNHPESNVKSYAEGVQRVRDSNGAYAFVMESANSDYETNQEPCDLVTTSGFLTTKTFALATRHNDTALLNLLDEGVLNLLERGTLRRLYEKWWHNYTDLCQDPNLDLLPRLYSTSLTLSEVSGVFYLIFILAVISSVSLLIEYFIINRRRGVIQ